MPNKYEVLAKSLCRVPSGKIEDYKTLFLDSNINDLDFMNYVIKDNLFMECILCASSSLYIAIENGQKNGNFDTDIVLSTLKYYIRYLTRPTPYGEFSGLGIITLEDGNYTDIQLCNESVKTRTRVDMGWIYKYIKHILAEKNLKMNLKFYFNSSCYVIGNRLINPYYSVQGLAEADDNIRLSLKYSHQIEYVKEISINGIICKDLISFLCKKNEDVNFETIESFVNQLIDNEILICELYPPLVNVNILDYIIDILEKRYSESDWIGYLKDIKNLTNKYDSIKIGQRTETFMQIQSKLKGVCESKEYLQVDAQIIFKNKTLGGNVKEKVSKLANFLLELAPINAEYNYITEYRERFLEKYGYRIEVPLLELLDEQIGIGAPMGYMSPPSKHSEIIQEKHDYKMDFFKDILFEKLALGQISNGTIILTDKDIVRLKNKFPQSTPESQLPKSFELYLSLLADSEISINEDKYMLLFSGCESSVSAGNSFGRFSDFVDNNDEYLKEIADKEREENICVVELFEQPRNGRSANVEITNTKTLYLINSVANYNKTMKVIPLKDIFIGIDADNSFYAKANSKKLYIKTTSMINHLYGSNAFRFLRDISIYKGKLGISDIMNLFKNPGILFFPRIVYDNIILSPKCWNITEDTWKYNKKGDFENFKVEVSKWKKQYNVPELVNHEEMDNILLLNLNNNLHLKLLFDIFKKKKNLFLTEAFSQFWLKDEKEYSYNNEFVFTYIKNNSVEKKQIKESQPLIYSGEQYSAFNRKYLFIGEEGWVFFKLYIDTTMLKDFIGNELFEFSNDLFNKQIIKKYFFIRYKDSREHIRFRVQINSDKIIDFIQSFQIWIEKNKKAGIIFDLSICTYTREAERYGGIHLIDYAEEYFMEDSKLVAKIFKMQNYNDYWKNEEFIAITCINDLMQNWGMNLEEREHWLTSNTGLKEYRDQFRKNEKKYRGCIAFELSEENENETLIQFLRERSQSIKNYRQAIEKAHLEGKLANTKNEILTSLIHMFCNRLKADNIWEKKVRFLTRHTLHSLIGYYSYKK